jgi:hypothetical protein
MKINNKIILLLAIVIVIIFTIGHTITNLPTKITQLPLIDKATESTVYPSVPITLWSSITDNETYIIGGWSLIPDDQRSCFTYIVKLGDEKGNIARKEIKLMKNSSFLSKWSQCTFAGSAAVYDAYILNTKYIAITTSEPGFIFFNRQDGTFLTKSLLQEPCLDYKFSTLYDGTPVIDVSTSKYCTTRKGQYYVKRYRLIIDDIDLQAPFSLEEYNFIESRDKLFHSVSFIIKDKITESFNFNINPSTLFRAN